MIRRLCALVLLFPPLTAAAKAETVSTFTLDGLSFVSFGDEQILLLPAGSTLKFRFDTPAPDGSVSFTIAPQDVAIDNVSLPQGGELQYSLVSTASGSMHVTPEGRELSFNANVRASLGGSAYTYAMPFTTEATSATNVPGTETLSVVGMRLVDGIWYGQIVGATTNKANAFPEPGAAVYTILSGTFDQIP